MPNLLEQPLGTVAYNGYTFNGSAKSKVTPRPIPDRANRTTVAVEYTLDVWAAVVPVGAESGTDTQFGNIRQLLTQPGGRLQFTGRGFGTFDINGAGTQKDIAYGPWPEIIEAVPVGAPNAWLIHWRCKTRLPECTGSTNYSGVPMAFNYELEFTRDPRGYTVRTITGYLEIPATRSGRNLPDTADAYWDQVYASMPQPPGFERSLTRKLSYDKRVINFTITDTQKPPSGFVIGTVDWEGEQDLAVIKGGVVGVQTISATYTVEDGRPKKEALERFINLVLSRVVAGLPFTQLGSLVPLEFRIRDQLHNQKISFSLSYKLITSTPTAILAAAGFFAPIPDSEWNQWAQTVSKSIGARGIAGMQFDKNSEVIIDLCTTQQSGCNTLNAYVGQENQLASTNFLATLPPPPQSYLNYMISVRLLGEAELHFHKPLNHTLTATGYLQNEMGADDPFGVPPAGARFSSISGLESGQPQDLVQVGATGEYFLVLEGYALRAGYPVPMPQIRTFGSLPVYLVGVDFAEGLAMNAGIPIHAARFMLVYRYPSVPLTSSIPTNPELRTTLLNQ